MEYISKESVVALIKIYSVIATDEQKSILEDILNDIINEYPVKEIDDETFTK